MKASPATLARQFALSKGVYDDINRTRGVLDELRGLRANLRELRGKASGDVLAAVDSIDRAAAALEGGEGGFGGGGRGGRAGAAPTLAGTIGELGQLYGALQEADVQPTTQLVAAVQAAQRPVQPTLARWDTLRARATTRLGTQLRPLGPPK